MVGIFVCLFLQAFLYGRGLDVSHEMAYNTLFRLRPSLQMRFEALPLGFIQDKGTGAVKKIFADDVDSLEVLLAHSLPELSDAGKQRVPNSKANLQEVGFDDVTFAYQNRDVLHNISFAMLKKYDDCP